MGTKNTTKFTQFSAKLLCDLQKYIQSAENKIDHDRVMMISDLGEIWNVFCVLEYFKTIKLI